jgi:CRISPR/Cas system CSM-associated protein Csm4 (group 5 of RAMP superfamily)
MTQDEEDDLFSYESAYDRIARLLGERETYPEKPKKPKLSDKANSKEAKQYSEDLALWEYQMEKYEEARLIVQKHNDGVEAHVENYIKKAAGLRNFNQAQQDLLWYRAWDKGHSSGYSEVYNCLCNLVEFINEFNKAK